MKKILKNAIIYKFTMQNIIEFYLKRIRIRKMTIKWIKTKQFLLEKYLKSKINKTKNSTSI